jgi:hypothetical protein
MQRNNLETFAAELATLRLRQVDVAVSILWFKDQESLGAEETAADLAQMMNAMALSSSVNVTRLAQQLRRNPDTVSGSTKTTFKIRLSSKRALTEKLEPLLANKPVKVHHHFLPESQTKGTRKYLISLAWQLNGCYEHGFYDGCAVMCRRMIESLLIEAFEASGKSSAIKDASGYKGLAEIIDTAKSGHHIKLSRNCPKTLDRIKSIGDTAAHDRAYITSQQDMDDISHEFRRVISELLSLANIHPTTA